MGQLRGNTGNGMVKDCGERGGWFRHTHLAGIGLGRRGQVEPESPPW